MAPYRLLSDWLLFQEASGVRYYRMYGKKSPISKTMKVLWDFCLNGI